MKEIIHFEKNIDKVKTDIFIGDIDWALSKLSLPQHILITDENLETYYPEFLKDKDYISLSPGEKTKSLSQVEKLQKQLLDKGLDRNSLLIGFGGGVITDLTGFVASTFMRGIDFGFISTSLLGQVDAVLGGKNGVNLEGYKNIIGSFSQAKFIISDPHFLKTLPEIELINGCAEVIKQFVIKDKEGFSFLEENATSFFDCDMHFLARLIHWQTKIKMGIVEQDEKEKGLRKTLNFGHSFGHAIEKDKGIKHGFAVSMGMHIAAKLSLHLGYLKEKDFSRLISILEKFKLPSTIDLEVEALISTMEKDKKRVGKSIDFILLEGIGKARIEKMSFDGLRKIIKEIEF